MEKPVWHFPQSVTEALTFLQEDKSHLHAGGTGIKRHMLRKWNSVVDISRLPIKEIKTEGETIDLGSGLTFAEVVDYFAEKDKNHILYKALERSASVSLRNRITLGGSLAAFPSWSDLAGPLLALDAEVTIEGKAKNRILLSEYFHDANYHRNSIITAIHIPVKSPHNFYYRQVRVQFDYPTFTVSVTADLTDGKWLDGRIIVVGTTGKFSRLEKLESYLKEFNGKDFDRKSAKENIELHFNNKPHCGSEYLEMIAAEKVLNGVSAILGGEQ